MVVTSSSSSLTQRTYAALRAQILSGEFRPGQRLRPTELAKDRSVSLNVVRESLNRLSGERLVQSSPQYGFTVVDVSGPDLCELTELRVLIETSAIRKSIENSTLEWQTDLVAAHHRLAGTAMASPDRPEQLTTEWMSAHNAFHVATMSGCGNRRMIELCSSLAESAAIYRHWSQLHDHGRRDIASEHRAIFQAALSRDADLTCRLHHEHIQRTAQIVVSSLSATDPAQDHESPPSEPRSG